MPSSIGKTWNLCRGRPVETVAEFMDRVGEIAWKIVTTAIASVRFRPLPLVVVWDCRYIMCERQFPLLRPF